MVGFGREEKLEFPNHSCPDLGETGVGGVGGEGDKEQF
jgi:hypothetical protein